jgi:hypothetical protein
VEGWRQAPTPDQICSLRQEAEVIQMNLKWMAIIIVVILVAASFLTLAVVKEEKRVIDMEFRYRTEQVLNGIHIFPLSLGAGMGTVTESLLDKYLWYGENIPSDMRLACTVKTLSGTLLTTQYFNIYEEAMVEDGTIRDFVFNIDMDGIYDAQGYRIRGMVQYLYSTSNTGWVNGEFLDVAIPEVS